MKSPPFEGKENEDGSYDCHLCGKNFSSYNGVTNHMRKHRVIPVACNFCYMVMQNNSAGTKHLLNQHPAETEAAGRKYEDLLRVLDEPGLEKCFL